ncbi:MAG: DUF1579 domain-containing protein [Chthoniobacterales bacterium]
MKTLKIAVVTIATGFLSACMVPPVWAEDQKVTTGAPDMNDPAMMAKMMELAKLNENHKLLGELAGNWSYTVKMWMDPSAAPMESKGTAVRKPIMDGRYYVADMSGKMEMPGPDGKPADMTFLGKSIEGYDNAKQKFVSAWIDNMGTGIMMSEGTYDAATKTFTYEGHVEMMPGMKTKVRETVKVTDKDHHLFEWYENRDGKYVKTMEIAYTRDQ